MDNLKIHDAAVAASVACGEDPDVYDVVLTALRDRFDPLPDGGPLRRLAPKQAKLLRHLCRRVGYVARYEDLVTVLDTTSAEVVRVIACQLRGQLRDPRWLTAVHGEGYTWTGPTDAAAALGPCERGARAEPLPGLTPQMDALLRALIADGDVKSHVELVAAAHMTNSAALIAVMSMLRQRIGDPRWIERVRGVGYRWRGPRDARAAVISPRSDDSATSDTAQRAGARLSRNARGVRAADRKGCAL